MFYFDKILKKNSITKIICAKTIYKIICGKIYNNNNLRKNYI